VATLHQQRSRHSPSGMLRQSFGSGGLESAGHGVGVGVGVGFETPWLSLQPARATNARSNAMIAIFMVAPLFQRNDTTVLRRMGQCRN